MNDIVLCQNDCGTLLSAEQLIDVGYMLCCTDCAEHAYDDNVELSSLAWPEEQMVAV